MKILVQTAGKAATFCRAGLKFTDKPRELEVMDDAKDIKDKANQITKAQYAQLEAEPMLKVKEAKAPKDK